MTFVHTDHEVNDGIARIFILEGADGAGKSVAGSELADIEVARGHNVNVVHNDVPNPSLSSRELFRQYFDQLKTAVFLRDRNNVSTVIDRTWVSEVIYGPLYRGGSMISPHDIKRLERFARTRGLYRLSVEAPLQVRLDRIHARGEKALVGDNWLLGTRYEKYFQSHNWITVNSLLTNHNK